jgi:anthranilate/para-aminobenzoate synthase component I
VRDPASINIRLDARDPAAAWNLPEHLSLPIRVLRCDADNAATRLYRANEIEHEWADPLAALDWMAVSLRESQARDRWIGYISYELGRLFEPLPPRSPDDPPLPLFVFTHHAGSGGTPTTSGASQYLRTRRDLHSNFTRHAYLQAVNRAIEYIRAGDVFQVNLSQRFTAGLTRSPEQIYTHLRESFPAEYGAFLDYGDFALLCNSPELFLRVTPDRTVITRPIKGTRPRQAGMDVELLHSTKDAAELNMIVDLERNDLGRVCEIGSVRVAQPRTIEAHPTVYHGVATIEGTLRHDIGFVDLLRATFPGGSITGAPKIRAMQIIDELEPVRRGPYCGAIGYLAGDGSMEFNIAIRTMIASDGLIHIPVGGGIVADSDPAEEYEETLVKAKAMFAAAGLSM